MIEQHRTWWGIRRNVGATRRNHGASLLADAILCGAPCEQQSNRWCTMVDADFSRKLARGLRSMGLNHGQ